MGETKKISSAVIRRLPRYYRYLGELIEKVIPAYFIERIECKDEGYCVADKTGFK